MDLVTYIEAYSAIKILIPLSFCFVRDVCDNLLQVSTQVHANSYNIFQLAE